MSELSLEAGYSKSTDDDDRGTKIPTRGEHKRRDRKERVDEKSGIEVRDSDRQIDQATNQSLERGNRQQHAPQPDVRARHEWPRRRRTAEHGDELASSHCLPQGLGPR